ncbi:MAG: MlaD family protein [Gemmataceae bacterium]|nr:MlaD family protein [Gemmataceae bacterium]MDW8265700.1 MlaD family protein [Gemmataceae bacterium]
MDERTLRIRIGGFMVLTLTLLGALIFLFSGAPTFFRAHHQYVAVFDNAAGISSGTPVRRAGVRIGEVQRIVLNEETGKVEVTLLLEKPYTVRRNEQARITQTVFGDATVDLVPVPPNGQPVDRSVVPPGSEVAAAPQVDAHAVFTQVANAVPEAQDTLREIRTLSQRLNRSVPLMEETAREFRDLARSSREAMPELRRTNDEIQGLAKSLRDAVPELRRTNDEIQVTARNWGKLGERLDVLLQSNQDKIVKALDDLTDAVQRIAATFNDENQKNLATTLKNIRIASENLEGMTRTTDEFIKESRLTVRRINDSLTRADEVMTNLQQVSKPLAERSDRIARNLDESIEKLNSSLSDVQEVMKAFGQSDGTVSRLLNDPALYNNLNDIAAAAVRMMPRIDRALRDIEVFTDKIARHPEALGVGGVVRPGTGLKEAPTTGWPRGPGH